MTRTQNSQSVGIVGAGVMGRLMALRLADAGYKVSIYDEGRREGIHSCSWIAGGMLSPFSELEKAEPIISKMGQRSITLWQELLPTLTMPVFFQQCGTLVVAHRQDRADLHAFRAMVASRLADAKQMADVDSLTLKELEPELAERFHAGVHFPAEAQLEPHELLPALSHALYQRNVTWMEGVHGEPLPGKVIIEGREYLHDLVVDTRGLRARPQLKLRGVRGEVMRFHAPEVRLTHMVRLMHPRYPLYIVPRPGNTYLIGATSIESDHDGPITVRSALELLSAVYSLHPGFAEAAVLEQTAGCRPAFGNNLPQISFSSGLLRINGLFRHGYLISPALAEEAMRLLAGAPPEYPSLSEVAHAGTYS